MKSTKFIFSAVAAAVIFSMGSATAEAKTTIRIGTFAGPEHPVTLAINYFKENIEKESNGEIVVKHFPNNQLGPESVVIDQIKRGTIQMAVTGSQIKKDEPNIGLSDTPYVIHSWAQARACYDEEGMKIMSGNYEKNTGVKIAGYMVNGFRELSSNRPVTNMKELQGLKIRIPDNEIHVHLFEALGTNNVMMPLPEVYNALETHMIDGQENPYATILASGFHEVQSDILETRHMFAIAPFLMNGKFYSKLSDSDKALVDKWIKKTVEYNWEISEKNDDDCKAALAKKGVKIHEMTPEMQKEIDAKLVDFYKWYGTIIPDAQKWIDYCKSKENAK